MQADPDADVDLPEGVLAQIDGHVQRNQRKRRREDDVAEAGGGAVKRHAAEEPTDSATEEPADSAATATPHPPPRWRRARKERPHTRSMAAHSTPSQ